jgi:thiamine-phosphate pyrophosphorylase
MNSKKRLLKKCKLYVILDKEVVVDKHNLVDAAACINRSSQPCIVQLRDKNSTKKEIFNLALKLRGIFAESHSLFIINDYCDVAQAVKADGLHLGQDDLPLNVARRLLGKDKIIGLSCHTLAQASRAQKQGADYIGVGPVFATATKPQYKPIGKGILKKIKDSIKIPYFAIGGINISNINELLLKYVTDRVAVCRAILKEKDIVSALEQFNHILNKNDSDRMC